MSKLSTFGPSVNVAVVGASGGIGAALCHELATEKTVDTVHALSRSCAPHAHDRIRPGTIDLFDEYSIETAAESVSKSAPLDLVIVASGLLHWRDIQPEKTLQEISADNMLDVFWVNTVGPSLVAKHFLPKLRRHGKTVLAALSARVGSIEDNRLGGWVSYRASKAALNMTFKTLAIEFARRRPASVIATLHPGTVDTNLSKPFSSRVDPGSLFSPQTAAAHLLRVIDGLSPEDSGRFFAWDGSRIPY